MHTAVMLSKHNISDSDKNSDDDNDDIVVDKSPDLSQVTAMSSWKQRCLRLFIGIVFMVLPPVFSSLYFNALSLTRSLCCPSSSHRIISMHLSLTHMCVSRFIRPRHLRKPKRKKTPATLHLQQHVRRAVPPRKRDPQAARSQQRQRWTWVGVELVLGRPK